MTAGVATLSPSWLRWLWRQRKPEPTRMAAIGHGLSARSAVGLALGSGVAGGAAAFSPLDLSPLFWVAADQIAGLSDGDPVGTWLDLSGNDYHETASGGDRPTYKTGIRNGLPVVRFNGSNYMKTATANPATSQPTTVFVVTNGPSVSGAVFDSNTAAAHLMDSGGGTQLRIYAGGAVQRLYTRDEQWHIHTARYHGASAFIRSDGRRHTIGNVGAGALAGVTLGSWGSGVYAKTTSDIAEVIVYGSALSLADMVKVELWLAAKWGMTAYDNFYQIVFEGDSLMDGVGAPEGSGPTWQLMATTTDLVAWTNVAKGGDKLSQMITQAATTVDPLFVDGAKNVLIVWGGVNDIGQDDISGADAYARLVTYCTARKAAHDWTIICLTLTKHEFAFYPPDYETERTAFNALLAANYTDYADALADVGAAANLQDPTNGTYFDADKLHLTTAGYAVVAAVVKPVLEGLPNRTS